MDYYHLDEEGFYGPYTERQMKNAKRVDKSGHWVDENNYRLSIEGKPWMRADTPYEFHLRSPLVAFLRKLLNIKEP